MFGQAKAGNIRHVRKAFVVGTGIVALAAPVVAAVPGIAVAGGSTEHFSLIDDSTNESTTTYSVIATGAFADGGTATKTGSSLSLQLSRGTVTLDLKNKHKGQSEGPGCVQVQRMTGSYAIAGGTGAYAGITGSGEATGTVTLVESSSGSSCGSGPVAAQATISGQGPASLGS
ncbi:MAG TPA: hypothetical protein VIY26_03860 [Acidimicrobiales bacterium]